MKISSTGFLRVTHRAAKKIRRGRVWITSQEIVQGPTDSLPFGAGDVVPILDAEYEDFIGLGFYNPHSRIRLRMLTLSDERVDKNFFSRRLERAWKARELLRLGWDDTDSFRLVHSESDGFPGLIVDVYGDTAVIQILSIGMENFRTEIESIIEKYPFQAIVEKSVGPSRRMEKLENRVQVLKGPVGETIQAKEFGLTFTVPWKVGQKTGFYLDQKENRRWVMQNAKNADVLDLCSYTGSFALVAALGGARKVIAVESSHSALEIAEHDLKSYGVSDRVELVQANVFDYIRYLNQQRKRFDLIILDPPPFARSPRHIRHALRGYRDLNRLAIRLLQPEGMLLTCSCSHDIDRSALISMLRQAAGSLPRQVKILDYRTAPPDHPVLLAQKETEYFQAVVLSPLLS